MATKMTKRVFQGVEAAAGSFLPALLVVPLPGAAWHLFYGDFIFYQGLKIPVLKGFYYV
jgi:hypothetical protein